MKNTTMLFTQKLSRFHSRLNNYLLLSLFSSSNPSSSPLSLLSSPSTPSQFHTSIPLVHTGFSHTLISNPQTLPTLFRNFSTSDVTKKEPIKPIKPNFPKFRSDGDDDDVELLVCPGCGVYMQGEDPKLPGYFIKPTKKEPKFAVPENEEQVGIPNFANEEEMKSQELENEKKPLVCVRCHSLRYYGRVKDTSVENLLPDFDFDHTIGPRLASTTGGRSVVLMVVDAADFDGSFPRKVAKLVSKTIEEGSNAWKEGKSGNIPRVVLVVTKIDLLPSSISPTGFEHWVRQRAREGGANLLTSVHLVSALRNWGLKNLVDDIRGLVGVRGNVWAIGAQNAGKSTLINSIGKYVEGKVTHLTEAPVPGTTLGIVRIEGILPGQAKLFDTPGLLHPNQISSRLTREEQKLVHIGKELKPRTYRLQAGYSVHIGGLTRMDIHEASADSIYLTIWASPYLPLHMGKTENASTMVDAHFGRQLQPPIGEKRVPELGEWVRREFKIFGNSWNVSSVDVAVAGLGWFALGLKGEAVVSVWTYDGVDVTLRNALIQQRAHTFEVTGFTVSKIVSRADGATNKQQMSKREKKKSGAKVTVPVGSMVTATGDTGV